MLERPLVLLEFTSRFFRCLRIWLYLFEGFRFSAELGVVVGSQSLPCLHLITEARKASSQGCNVGGGLIQSCHARTRGSSFESADVLRFVCTVEGLGFRVTLNP